MRHSLTGTSSIYQILSLTGVLDDEVVALRSCMCRREWIKRR